MLGFKITVQRLDQGAWYQMTSLRVAMVGLYAVWSLWFYLTGIFSQIVITSIISARIVLKFLLGSWVQTGQRTVLDWPTRLIPLFLSLCCWFHKAQRHRVFLFNSLEKTLTQVGKGSRTSNSFWRQPIAGHGLWFLKPMFAFLKVAFNKDLKF